MGRALALALLIALALAGPLRAQQALSVIATGQAFVRSEADSDAARRRALGEALVNAALAGGAELVGYTAMSQARITRDLTVLRATGQVLSHRVIDAHRDGQTWTVRIEAVVGPLAERLCAGGRTMALRIDYPQVSAPPQAPAWAAPLAQTVAANLVDTAARHPRVAFDGVLAAAGQPSGIPAQHDYTALTRGVVQAAPGDHRLSLSLRLEPRGGTLGLITDVTLTGPDGRGQRRQVLTETRLPSGSGVDLLTGRSRTRAEGDLTRGVTETLAALLDAAGCEAPSAILARAGDALSVPIGRRHGLSRGSLGVIEGTGPEVGLLEIVALDGTQATLRPLDPTVSAALLAGARVHFVETGL
jgi:hypothetical protein